MRSEGEELFKGGVHATMGFCQRGQCESIKATAHIGLGVLSAICAGYNVAAWLVRLEPHLLRNAVIYSAITGLEVVQVRKHLQRD